MTEHPINEYGTFDCPYFEEDLVATDEGMCPLCGEEVEDKPRLLEGMRL